jgi:CRP/FNR family transcriptional regulator
MDGKHSRRKPRVKRASRQRDDASGSLGKEGWKAFVDLLPSQEYPAGTKLLQQGSSAHAVYFIERGLVKLTRLESAGEEVIVGLRFRGWLLGAASVILQEVYPVTATTLTDSHIRRIPAENFSRMVKTNGQLSWYLHQMHSREVYDWVVQVSGLGCLLARRRLEQLLWQLKQAEVLVNAKDGRIQLPITQVEMAQLLAVTPQYLCRLLKELEAEGQIQRVKRWWRILLSENFE